MKRVPRAVIVAALATLAASPSHAQDSVQVAIGARLRLRTDSTAAWQYGRFGGVHADSLVLRPTRSGANTQFRLTSLQEIDVRERDPAVHESNATLGVIIGVAASVALVHYEVQRCDRKDTSHDGPPCALGYTTLPFVALIGAVAGGIVGSKWPANRWRPVVVVAAQP